MATSDRLDQRKVETYARTLLEAAREEGREQRDMEALNSLSQTLDEVADIIRVILQEGDERLLPQIAARYQDLFNAGTDIVAVDVTTAIPLDDELRDELQKFLEVQYSAPVFLVEHVDPSIIGGIIFNARGQRRDASIRTQLDVARRALKSGGGE
jgi:F-type H+-transporting ATPase subunit delta